MKLLTDESIDIFNPLMQIKMLNKSILGEACISGI